MSRLQANRTYWRVHAFVTRLIRQEHRSRRSAKLRLAIISSFGSKLCGLALQTIAIPLVYRTLGQHSYQLFLLLTAALATIGIAQMGAGPGLTQGIAAASAAGRRDREASLLNAAFRLSAIAALVGGAIVLAIIYLIPPEKIFGPAFAHERAAILSIANVCVLVAMVQMIAGVVDSALSGYQEQVLNNLGVMLSNIISIALLFIVCRNSPTVIGVVLVLYGAPMLSRIANLIGLSLRRPYLLQGFLRSCRGSYAVLLNVGLAFWAMQVGSLIEQNSGTYVLTHLASTQATNLFAIVFKSLSLAGSVVVLVTQPLWPAFVDAIGQRDFAWIHRSYARIRVALTLYSCLVALVMMTGGQWIFQHLVHVDTAGNSWLFWILGINFVANIWTHLYYVSMLGMPGIWRVAAVVLSENLLMLLFSLLLVPRLGASGMALAYLLASVVLPAWLLPVMMKRSLQRLSGH